MSQQESQNRYVMDSVVGDVNDSAVNKIGGSSIKSSLIETRMTIKPEEDTFEFDQQLNPILINDDDDNNVKGSKKRDILGNSRLSQKPYNEVEQM